MDVQQILWTEKEGWQPIYDGVPTSAVENSLDAHLVIYYGAIELLEKGSFFAELKKRYPFAHIVGCSAASEVYSANIEDKAIVAVAIKFLETAVRVVRSEVKSKEQSYVAGKQIGNRLRADDLKAVMLFTDGIAVDGQVFSASLSAKIGKEIPLIGVMASGGVEVLHTLVGGDDKPQAGNIAAIGLYGRRVEVRQQKLTGLTLAKASHTITQAEGGKIELIGKKPAAEIYEKNFSAEEKKNELWPITCPLYVYTRGDLNGGVIRTVLEVDEKDVLHLAGAVKKSQKIKFTTCDDAAPLLAEEIRSLSSNPPITKTARGDRLTFFLGCAERRAVYGKNIVKELAAANDAMGRDIPLIGGYFNGVFLPATEKKEAKLHNFTLGLVTLQEV